MKKARPMDGPGATSRHRTALLALLSPRAQIAPARQAVVVMRVMVKLASESGDHGTQPKGPDISWARDEAHTSKSHRVLTPPQERSRRR